MAKVRVYELAKELGVDSKALMAKLSELGEFVRSASSTIEAPGPQRALGFGPSGAAAATRSAATMAGAITSIRPGQRRRSG